MSDTSYEVLAGRYELHRQLATGGSADVYLARDQLLNRPVAVKILSAELAEDEAFVERLRREAQLVASLNHQNIVGVFDQGEEDGAPFIVMEYVDGRSLADVLRNEGRLHPDRAAKVAIDVAAALDAAHRQGMVHMDVKPGNVLITADGQVKLADFGIAKALTAGSETDMTAEGGTVLGTATYLSPEQAQGQKVGPRSDVYSLAVVLYEMMSGRPPFIGDSPVEIARKHVDQAPQRPSRLGVDIAQSLEAITLKGLAKSPVNRYPSVRDFAADLKRYLGGAHSLNGGPGAAGPKAKADAVPQKPVRPTTGRSTPPDIEDATVLIPATAPPTARPAAVPAAVAQPQTVPVMTAEPVPVEPVIIQRDDTWKRNALFFVALMILLVLLGFLGQAFIAALTDDGEEPSDGADGVETVDMVDLEDYTGLEMSQAISLIESQGLVPNVTAQPNSDVPDGRIFSQEPAAGRRVESGSIVNIVVSEAEGRIEVPSVVGFPVDEAARQLGTLGFQFQTIEEDSDIFPAGEVISQDPLALEPADRGSLVVITVSLGPSERTVPDLSGQPFNEALSEVFELGFRFVEIQEPDPEIEEGIVLRTEPASGALLRGDGLLTIYVSSGVARVQVPSVVELLVDSARQQLVSSGFEVEVEFEAVTETTQDARVLEQSPPPFIELEEGETVRIIVGQLTVEETTTTTVAPAETTTTTTEAPAETTTTTTEAAADG